MIHKADLVIIGVCVGLALGIPIAALLFWAARWYRKHARLRRCANERSVTILPIRENGFGTSTDFSASLQEPETPRKVFRKNKDKVASVSGILKYSYKYAILSTSLCIYIICALFLFIYYLMACVR